MIVGYEASAAERGGIGSLLLAGKRGYDWVYVGTVGTGFDGRMRPFFARCSTSSPLIHDHRPRLRHSVDQSDFVLITVL
jgi:bifunctional non-homologous end joining protein LigD